MINHTQLRQHVIRPVLRELRLKNTEAAEELLVLTACVESRCGYYLRQIAGPAMGIFQMEPATHKDLWDNYLAFHPELAEIVQRMAVTCQADEMVWNLNYATAMARIHYWRVKHPLPDTSNTRGLAQYWKAHYNSYLGRGNVDDAIQAYRNHTAI